MNDDPVRRAVTAVLGLCTGILLIAAVYFLAEYRAQQKALARMGNAVWLPPPVPLQREPLEAGGIEGLVTAQGLVVTAVEGRPKLPGVQVGDVLRTANGQPITSPSQLRQLPAGAVVVAQRNGQSLRLDAAWSARPPARPGPPPQEARAVDVRGLDGQLTAEGLWVNTVEGEAATWGLRPGDLVRSIDGRPLSTRADSRTLLRSLDAQRGFTFELVRDGARVYLPHAPGEPGAGATEAQVARTGSPQLPAARSWGATMGGGGGAWPGGATGLACPVCGAWHRPGWRRGTCWRCGSLVGVGQQPPAAGDTAGAFARPQ